MSVAVKRKPLGTRQSVALARAESGQTNLVRSQEPERERGSRHQSEQTIAESRKRTQLRFFQRKLKVKYCQAQVQVQVG